jgi:hypothetical protein
MNRAEIYRLIANERNRQEIKFPGRSAAAPQHSPERRLRILVEEDANTKRDLKAELVQVAAVCVAWLETMS